MLQLLIVLLLIVLNAFFALSEMAVMTSRKSRLRQMAEHSRGARKALALAEHPDHLLSTVQIGITLIGVLTGLVGGEAIPAHSFFVILRHAVPILMHVSQVFL